MKRLLSISIALVLMLSLSSVVFAEQGKNLSAFDIPDTEIQKREESSIRKYNKLLEYWSYVEGEASDVQGEFPDFYGGAYLDENKNLIVQVTEDSMSIRNYFGNIIQLDNVYFTIVEKSYNDLLTEYFRLSQEIVNNREFQDSFGVVGIGLDIKENGLIVLCNESDSTAFSSSAFKSYLNSISSFKLTPVPGCNYEECSVVYPGDQVYHLAATYKRSSVGFWAYDSDDNIGIVTTFHGDLLLDSQIHLYDDDVVFGSISDYQYGGNVDAAFVVEWPINSYTPTRYVPGWNFSLYQASFVALPVGASVYSRGYASGLQYGTVTSNSTNWTNGMYDMVLTSSYAQHGDSGGIVAGSGNSTNRYLAGIVIGKSSDCMVYCKYLNIKNALDITMY